MKIKERHIEALRCAWKRTPKQERRNFRSDTLLNIGSGVLVPAGLVEVLLLGATPESISPVIFAAGGSAVINVQRLTEDVEKMHKRYKTCLKEIT